MLGLGTGEVWGCSACGGMGMWPKGRLEGQVEEPCLRSVFWKADF